MPNNDQLLEAIIQQAEATEQRYLRGGGVQALDEAVAAWEQVLQHPHFATIETDFRLAVLNDSAGTYLRRYWARGNLNDLSTAISAWETAVATTPPESPDLPRHLNNLGTGLRDRYARLGDLKDLQAGIAAYQQATELGQKDSLEQWLRAARNWLNWADERNSWEEMEKAYPSVQEASNRLVETQLLREHQEAFLRETEGLAVKVAYARLQRGQLPQAVEALEQGIARLLSVALMHSRADLTQLQQDAPKLCVAYQAQVTQLQNAQRAYQQAPPEQQENRLKDFQDQDTALDNILQHIRQLPGHENFLRVATGLETVYQTAQTTPLIYLFATAKGGYALVVFQKKVQAIPLPELMGPALREKMVRQEGKELAGYFGAYFSQSSDPQIWFETLEKTTEWLWQVIWQALSKALLPNYQRITLIPIGWLNLLPLHAAWTLDATQPTGKRYVLDDFTIAYAPNALSLQKAKERATLTPDKLLAIDEPKPVNANKLPSSSIEVNAIAQYFTQPQLFRHEQATLDAVKHALNSGDTVLHFSCHGNAELTNPLETGLLMAHDETLTVQDFFNAQLQVRLVTLSACETGMIGIKQIEEVVGLPASLLQAGVAGVVASLWSVSDLSTAMLMVRFYTFWQKENLEPAEALRQAQIWMRDTTHPQKQVYFEQQTHLPRSVVDEFINYCAFTDTEESNFQHPFHWAAFGCYGV